MIKGQRTTPRCSSPAYQLFTAQTHLLPANNEKSKADLKRKPPPRLDAAVKVAKPSDDIYVDVMITHAARLGQEGKGLKDVEGIYQEMLAKRHNDPRVRLAAAKMMSGDKSKRESAIGLYSEPLTTNPARRQGACGTAIGKSEC